MISPVLIPIFASFLVLFGFVAGMIYWKRRQQMRRKAETMALADRLQMSFSEKDRFGLHRQLQEFALFRRERSRWGHKGRIRNVIQGQVDGIPVYLFEYAYLVSTGKSAHWVEQTVFFADNKDWYLPNFHLRPESWWQQLQARLGLSNDINFAESPDFSKRFRLTGEFESLIRQQFSPALQQLLLNRTPVQVEGKNYYLIAYKPRKLLNADEAQTFFESCCALTRQLQTEGKMELLQLAELKVALPEMPVPPIAASQTPPPAASA